MGYFVEYRYNKESIPSRAYIAFKSPEKLSAFSQAYDGHTFRDKAGMLILHRWWPAVLTAFERNFSPAVATDTSRNTFVSNIVSAYTHYQLDGIDIDWEYPATATDAQNFVLLLQACRQAFDNYSINNGLNYHFLITIASPAGPANYQIMNLAGMDPYVDSW